MAGRPAGGSGRKKEKNREEGEEDGEEENMTLLKARPSAPEYPRAPSRARAHAAATRRAGVCLETPSR